MICKLFAIKDANHADPFSKINNFIYEWIKWFPYIKLAPRDYTFSNDDIIIVSLDDASDPYFGYKINTSCKKIYIVHTVSDNNISQMHDALFIIYMNPYIKKACELRGINKPNYCAKRYPLLDIKQTDIIQHDIAYICGSYNQTDEENFYEYLLNIHKNIPKIHEFYIAMSWELSNTKYDSLKSVVTKLNKSIGNQRKITLIDKNDEFIIMQFKMRMSKYICIYSGQYDIEYALDNLHTINFDDSSMLAYAQSYKSNILYDNKINFISHSIYDYTFKIFASDLQDIFKKYSMISQ